MRRPFKNNDSDLMNELDFLWSLIECTHTRKPLTHNMQKNTKT